MSRARVAQLPPTAPLDGFPIRALGEAFYRAAVRGPWWFCTCGDCRFDLVDTAGTGTLYAGTEPLTGVLEFLGPELVGRPVARDLLARRTVWALRYDRPLELADLCNPEAIGHGVTNELSAMTPYAVPQAWAAAFAAEGWDGIAYRARFVTATEPTGVAVFDTAGAHDWPAERHCAGDDPVIVDALAACHITVADPPTAGQLDLR